MIGVTDSGIPRNSQEHEWQVGQSTKLHVRKQAAFLIGCAENGRNHISASSFGPLRQAAGLINLILNVAGVD